jgi:hypothetical protein
MNVSRSRESSSLAGGGVRMEMIWIAFSPAVMSA